MGRYASDEALAKKRNEPLLDPAFKPGLSLGHFASQAEAVAAL